MTPEPTPAGTVKGRLNWSTCVCSLVIWTTAGLTRCTTARTAAEKSPGDKGSTGVVTGAGVVDAAGGRGVRSVCARSRSWQEVLEAKIKIARVRIGALL